LASRNRTASDAEKIQNSGWVLMVALEVVNPLAGF
jgi:hypothetical protein